MPTCGGNSAAPRGKGHPREATTVLGAATLAIVAHLTDALHAGVWLQIPQPGYLLARGLTLAAGAAVLLVGWISNARRCERLPDPQTGGTRRTTHRLGNAASAGAGCSWACTQE